MLGPIMNGRRKVHDWDKWCGTYLSSGGLNWTNIILSRSGVALREYAMGNGRFTMQTKKRNSGFSLIELVIVVVIIAIIGAIAIPRMSRGAAGAADSALVGN